ncbi:MAG TPA: hypothetical protein PLT07_11575 [Trueperaceae bacterium]|nr:hypothetical protein [Trueperaceae bacterium]
MRSRVTPASIIAIDQGMVVVGDSNSKRIVPGAATRAASARRLDMSRNVNPRQDRL